MDIIRKGELLRGFTRVPAGFLELLDDIVDGGQAKVLFYVILRLDLFAQRCISHQFPGAHMEVPGHFVHNMVRFRMHRRVVQRIGRAGNAEEAGALLEGLGAQARYLPELLPAGKIAVLFAVCDNSLGQRRANARHILQQVRAGSIDSHPHAVHAAFYRIVQLFLEEPLVYVVLILPNAQRLGVYLHQFCQRVHQATADRNGTAYGDIVFREFLPSYLGGRIHGSAILAHGENAYAFRQPHHPHKSLRLPSGGSGADGNYLYIILFHQIGHGGNGLYLFGHGRMRENDVVVQEVRRFPCASRQTTLQPVRKPGSMAITRFCPTGGASRS